MELKYQSSANTNKLNEVRIIGELSTGRQGHEYQPGGEGLCAFAPDESRFAWSCGFRKVVVIPWNRYKNCLLSQDNEDALGRALVTERISLDCGFQVCSVAFGATTPDGDLLHPRKQYWTRFDYSKDLTLATGHTNGRIRIWDPYTGKLLLELSDHKFAVHCLAFAHDGSLLLVSGSQDATIKVWDLCDDGNMVKTLRDNAKVVMRGLALSHDSRLLCSVGTKQKVLLWDMETYDLRHRLLGHMNDVNACSFSPDGALLATASTDTRVIVWDVVSGVQIRVLHHLLPPRGPIYMAGANDRNVRGVSFSPNGCQIASSCTDGLVRFWDLTSGQDECPEAVGLGIADDVMMACGFSPAGGAVAVCYLSGSSVFYCAPAKVPSLRHLCRVVVRKRVVPGHGNGLGLPTTLVGYLQYRRREW